MKKSILSLLLTILAFCKVDAADLPPQAIPRPVATNVAAVQITPAQVLSALAEKVGLVICVGTSDGALEASIAEAGKGNVLVQGVSLNPPAAAAAREHIAKAGWAGYASVATVPTFLQLPYNDHLANVVVADLDAPGAPAFEEVVRVVRPFGASLVRRKGVWEKVVKPLPPTMDDWTHYDGHPDSNPQSKDILVGRVSGLQYMASGYTNALSSMRLAGGRRIQGVRRSGAYIQLPDTFQARDAFNGLPQWRNDYNRGIGIPQDRITATDDTRVVGMFSFPGPAEVLDARTGERQLVLTEGLKMEEPPKGVRNPIELQNIILGDTIIQACGADVVGLNATTGKRLWAWKAPQGELPAYLAAGGGSCYVAITQVPTRFGMTYGNTCSKVSGVVAIDLAKGSTRWTSREANGFYSFGIVLSGDAVYLVDTNPKERPDKTMSAQAREYGDLLALKTSDGSVFWRRDLRGVEPADAFWHNKLRVQDGFVHPTFSTLVRGFDTKTGKDGPVLFRFGKGEGEGGNKLVFCSVARGTARGQLCGKMARFVDYTDGKFYTEAVSRGTCDEGQFPAYGLIHTGSEICGCTSFLRGMVGFQSAQDTLKAARPIPEAERVERGVAFELLPETTGGWSYFRGDAKRTCSSATPLNARFPAAPSTTIKVPTPPSVGLIGTEWSESNLRSGTLTPAVVEGNLLVTAAVDASTVQGYDAVTGKPRWMWRGAGRVTSSPTIARGLVIFGSNDGYATALRATDGAMVWRRFVAPNRRQIVVDGQVESLWPAFGSVTVLGDQAFVVAGRHNQCDGGVRISRLDLKTGALQAEAVLTSNNSDDPTSPGIGDSHGRSADVLALNMTGENLAMSNMMIDPKTMAWTRIPARDFSLASKNKPAQPARWLKSGPAWSYDDPNILAFISAPAACMFDKRGSSNSHKGQSGYRFLSRSPYQDGYQCNMLAIDGHTMYLANAGKLLMVTMGKDWLPTDTSKGKFSKAAEDLGNVGVGMLAMITTPGQVICGMVDDTKTKLLIFDRATKKKVSETVLPARIVANGLAAAGGRLYVTLENGEVAIIGG